MDVFKGIKLINFGTAVEVKNILAYYGEHFENAPDKLKSTSDKDFSAPQALKNPAAPAFQLQPFQDTRTDPGSVSTYGHPVMSLIGTPVLSNFNLEYNGQKLSYAINAVLFTVRQARNIVKTPVPGRDGTVKQFICEGDWRINAKLVISDINRVFPYNLSRQIAQFVAIKDDINIHSWFLNDIFNIRQVVIDDKTFEQHQGKGNTCFMNFDFLSDTPENLD